MKMLLTKTVFATSVALATLIAAETAYAQEYLSHEAAYARKHHAAPEVYDSQASPRFGFGPRATEQPNDVVTGNRQIGRDPDPFIRGEMLRHSGSGWPD
jgi:hypothetical protein